MPVGAGGCLPGVRAESSDRRGGERRLRILATAIAAAALLLLPALPAWQAVLPGSVAQAAQRIDTVRAVVRAPGALPPPVERRMEASIEAISEQLLVGKPAALGNAQADEAAALISEVFDKVLVGYTVRSVRVIPAAQALVRVELLPWDDTIDSVTVETHVDGMPPEVEQMVRRDLAGIEQVFDRSLIGLPVAATDWTNGVLKREVNEFLAAHLPEFRADFDVAADAAAHVTLTVYPRVPVVRTVDLSMRSDTLPNMLLLTHRELMRERVDMLVGVPVAFTERHRAAFEALFAAALDAQPDFRHQRMKTVVAFTPGERATVMCRSDSQRYRLRLTGWLDIGRSAGEDHSAKDDLLVRLHAGRMLTPRDEAYGLLDVTPQDVAWRWQMGWHHSFGQGMQVGMRYDFKDERLVWDAIWQLTRDWLLRYEYHEADSRGEGALRYRLHDFLSVEYALDDAGGWLRLIGNF